MTAAAIEADLLPCPLCGAPLDRPTSQNDVWVHGPEHDEGCLLVGLQLDDEDDIWRWNTRQPTTPTTGEDDVERAALGRLHELQLGDANIVKPTGGASILMWAANEIFAARAALAAISPTTEDAAVIDLDREFWESLVQAASQSSWMPPDYHMNDWVSDCARFLREGHPPITEDAEKRELVEAALHQAKGCLESVQLEGRWSFVGSIELLDKALASIGERS